MEEQHKVAIITGGAKGIGKATGKIFIENGISTCILDVDAAEGNKLQEELGKKLLFIKADVSKPEDVIAAVKQCVAVFGRIDYLVNNAGIQKYATAVSCTEDDWDLIMNVNLKSYFLCAKYCLPHIQAAGGGCVINVASVQSFVASANAVHYVTAKAALLGLTRSIAIDFAPNIRCVAVCPGTVDTPMVRSSWGQAANPSEIEEASINMHLVKRVAQPEEIGEFIFYLCSPKAGFITGQALRIDGGLGVAIDVSVKEGQKKK